VLLALFADIHANRQAFSACLDVARARGAEQIIFLGDYVGYGADPEWTVEVVMDLVDGGALAKSRSDGPNQPTTFSVRSNASALTICQPRPKMPRTSGSGH
jgi:predicted phosphodiesterase